MTSIESMAEETLVEHAPLRDPHYGQPARAPGGLAGWRIRKLAAYVESNIADSITASELAALVGLSIGHFSRMFRHSFGMPPHRYIMQRRMVRAQVLMTTSLQSLACVALECGLTDQAHLSRLFRRIVGMSPSAWRREALLRLARNPENRDPWRG